MVEIKAETLARMFHDTYEGLAPHYGYETREDTRDFDSKTPNGQLMIAVCGRILEQLQAIEEKQRRYDEEGQ